MTKYKQVNFVVFKGISLVSKTIKFYTRSDYSHVAFIMPNNKTLIEAWTHGSKIKQWWDYSTPANHTNGTPYEIWGLVVSEDDWIAITNTFMDWADEKLPYNWFGIIGFVLKNEKDSDRGKFCSEGCIYPFVQRYNWDKIDPSEVSPEDFVRIMQAAGGSMIEEGVVTNGLLKPKEE